MKRIIDIDEDYYEMLKYNVENGQKYKPWEIIANSTPYEERPQSKWEVDKHGEHFCPKCGHYALYEEDQENDYYEVQSNFCPECGANLKGEEK